MSRKDEFQTPEKRYGKRLCGKCGSETGSVCSVDGSPYCEACFLRALEGTKSSGSDPACRGEG